eukprot:2143055-Pyramimonas_sp.AAC.1
MMTPVYLKQMLLEQCRIPVNPYYVLRLTSSAAFSHRCFMIVWHMLAASAPGAMVEYSGILTMS